MDTDEPRPAIPSNIEGLHTDSAVWHVRKGSRDTQRSARPPNSRKMGCGEGERCNCSMCADGIRQDAQNDDRLYHVFQHYSLTFRRNAATLWRLWCQRAPPARRGGAQAANSRRKQQKNTAALAQSSSTSSSPTLSLPPVVTSRQTHVGSSKWSTCQVHQEDLGGGAAVRRRGGAPLPMPQIFADFLRVNQTARA